MSNDTINQVKKRRLDKETKKSNNHSKIYQPFRAIGYVTNEIPYVINNFGNEYFLTTCVGTSFQTYNVKIYTLTLLDTNTVVYSLEK